MSLLISSFIHQYILTPLFPRSFLVTQQLQSHYEYSVLDNINELYIMQLLFLVLLSMYVCLCVASLLYYLSHRHAFSSMKQQHGTLINAQDTLHKQTQINEQKQKGLVEKNNELLQEISSLTDQLSSQDSEHHSQIQQLQDTHSSAIAALQQKFQREMDDIKQVKDKQVSDDKQALDKQIQNMKKSHDDDKKTHAKQIDDLKKSHNTQLEELKKSHNKQTEDNKKNHDKLLEDLKKSHDKQLADHKKTHDNLLEGDRKKLEKQLDELKASHHQQLQDMKQAHDKQSADDINKQHQHIQDLKNQLADEREKHAVAVQDASSRYAALQATHDELQQQLSQLDKQQQQHIHHAQQTNALKQDMKQQQQEYDRNLQLAQDKYHKALQDNDDSTKKLFVLQNSHDDLHKQQHDLKASHDALCKQHDALQNKHDLLQKQHDALQSKYDALQQKYDDLQHKHHDATQHNQALQAQLHELQQTHEDALQLNDELQSNINDLQHEQLANTQQLNELHEQKQSLQAQLHKHQQQIKHSLIEHDTEKSDIAQKHDEEKREMTENFNAEKAELLNREKQLQELLQQHQVLILELTHNLKQTEQELDVIKNELLNDVRFIQSSDKSSSHDSDMKESMIASSSKIHPIISSPHADIPHIISPPSSADAQHTSNNHDADKNKSSKNAHHNHKDDEHADNDNELSRLLHSRRRMSALEKAPPAALNASDDDDMHGVRSLVRKFNNLLHAHTYESQRWIVKYTDEKDEGEIYEDVHHGVANHNNDEKNNQHDDAHSGNNAALENIDLQEACRHLHNVYEQLENKLITSKQENITLKQQLLQHSRNNTAMTGNQSDHINMDQIQRNHENEHENDQISMPNIIHDQIST